ncbi:hypothetical protein FB451DRAFT_1563317 [Mycena latifolia]|nr:hypothetical protein FB451DRAFT_1563317 [Mycena latifolia]
MSDNETLGQFVSQLINRLFFQEDISLVISTFERDVAADAKINFNGKDMSSAQLLEAIKGWHETSVAKLTAPMEHLAVVPLDPAGHTGVVAHVVKTKHTSKKDGTVLTQVSVANFKVEERGGRKVMVNWGEVLQNTPA